jgi:hypothetical protein
MLAGSHIELLKHLVLIHELKLDRPFVLTVAVALLLPAV